MNKPQRDMHETQLQEPIPDLWKAAFGEKKTTGTGCSLIKNTKFKEEMHIPR